MDQLLNILITSCSFIVLIGIIIGFHELGHFLVARQFGVHVIRFKIGFGKTLFSKFDKRGTEFSIGLLPLGGYVQMLGESSFLEENESKKDNYRKKISYSDVSLGARAFITSAGPLANFLLAIAAYFLIFLIGTKDLVPIVGQVNENSLAMEAGLDVGDTIISIDNKLISSYRDLNTVLASRVGETGSIEVKFQKVQSNIISFSSVDITDWLSSELEQSVVTSFGINPFMPAIISFVQKDSPAQKSGMLKGDQVLEVENSLIESWHDLVSAISNLPDSDAFIKVQRDSEILLLPISVGSTINEMGIKIGRIGIARISSIEEMPQEMIVVNKAGPVKALFLAINETYRFTVLILDSIGKLISGSISSENIGGPIQISVLAGSAAKAGFISFINMVAILSINLGLLNLLPIPILDGGQLVLISIEKLKGSPVSEVFIEYSYRIGLFLVVGLMLYAVFNDIARIV